MRALVFVKASQQAPVIEKYRGCSQNLKLYLGTNMFLWVEKNVRVEKIGRAEVKRKFMSQKVVNPEFLCVQKKFKCKESQLRQCQL